MSFPSAVCMRFAPGFISVTVRENPGHDANLLGDSQVIEADLAR